MPKKEKKDKPIKCVWFTDNIKKLSDKLYYPKNTDKCKIIKSSDRCDKEMYFYKKKDQIKYNKLKPIDSIKKNKKTK